MNDDMRAAAHHALAVDHHGRSARGHREASRHYKTGKDFAHAAHQALAAHGHALHALAYGRAAVDMYAAQEGSPIPGYLARFVDKSPSMELVIPVVLDGSEHHATAADHHDAAARNHEAAKTHVKAEHRIRALHSTKVALDHAMHALYHGNQAAMHHVMYLGSTAAPRQDITVDLLDQQDSFACSGTAPFVVGGNHATL